MSSRIKKEKSCSKTHVVISDVSDRTKKLKKNLNRKDTKFLLQTVMMHISRLSAAVQS